VGKRSSAWAFSRHSQPLYGLSISKIRDHGDAEAPCIRPVNALADGDGHTVRSRTAAGPLVHDSCRQDLGDPPPGNFGEEAEARTSL
jgi:hypothetical protein